MHWLWIIRSLEATPAHIFIFSICICISSIHIFTLRLPFHRDHSICSPAAFYGELGNRCSPLPWTAWHQSVFMCCVPRSHFLFILSWDLKERHNFGLGLFMSIFICFINFSILFQILFKISRRTVILKQDCSSKPIQKFVMFGHFLL